MHLNSILLFEKYAKSFFKDGIKILEIGPNDFPTTYQKIIGKGSIKWDTIDISANDKLTYKAVSEYEFPIEDDYYDIVLSGQVIEHVRKIWVWAKELSRVCKKGGLVITVNPVSHPYHKIPYDCWRIYPEGMKALYEDANLQFILSACNSLEKIKLKQRGFRNITYGKPCPPEAIMGSFALLKKSIQNIRKPKLFLRFLLIHFKKFVGWPISCGLDTITIGRKKD